MRRLILALTIAAAVLVLPSTSMAREPSNQNDPCSRAGQNTCGTNGVGFYQRYRYGIRWFGDYRGAVANNIATFCIDLRWWYPAKRFAYKEVTSGTLKNSNGRTISTANQSRMSYAIWNYGRSTNRNQQAAAMLYVHSLMGDAAPGEVDPSAISPAVQRIYSRISENANKYRGPYRVVATAPSDLSVGQRASVTVRVLSATGHAVPNVTLRVSSKGGVGAPTTVKTGTTGVANVNFTPMDVTTGFSAKIDAVSLAANKPKIYRATTPRSARNNAQRLATYRTQSVTTSVSRAVRPGGLAITTKASPTELLVGEQNRDTVTVKGLPAGVTRDIAVNVYGPFRTQDAIQCIGTPAQSSTLTVTGSGTTTAQPFTPQAPGWYQYQLVAPGDVNIAGVTTSCSDTLERFKARVQPQVVTKVTSATLAPGSALADTVIATGLHGETVTVKASLYGPFPTREAIKCDVPPIWTGQLSFTGDGEKLTDSVNLTVPGYYTYRETIDESDLVKPVETPCADVAETAIVTGSPQISTQISSQTTSPGSSISDTITITGLGSLAVPVQVELWGPYASVPAISCSGTPVSTQTFTKTGDGVHTSDPVVVDQAGYYTYRVSVGGTEGSPAATAPCGEPSETTFSKPGPAVTTVASAEAVRPGAMISDTVRVTGLGKTPATVQLKLYGPFASRTAIRCTGAPVWTGRINVKGDGTYRSARVKIAKVGFYTFQEEILPSGFVPRVKGTCARAAETVLGRPLILTGPGDPASDTITAPSSNSAPTKVEIDRLNISAPVVRSGINTRLGALAVPSNVRRLGWWRDGAAPGDIYGTTLIAGHVDSKVQGAGAFKQLYRAKAGMRIRVTTSDGRVRQYRVTTTRRILKESLPANIFTQRGAAKLVLVTCGGPFNSRTGHYRDNIIVTAVPV